MSKLNVKKLRRALVLAMGVGAIACCLAFALEFPYRMDHLKLYIFIGASAIMALGAYFEPRWMVLICVGMAPLTVLQTENTMGDALSSTAFVMGLAGAYFLRRKFKKQVGETAGAAIVVYAIYAGASLFSGLEALHLSGDFLSSAELLLLLPAFLIFNRVPDRISLLREIFSALALGCLLVMLYSFFLSPWAGKQAPFPFYMNANTLSATLVMGLPFLIWESFVRRGKRRYLFMGLGALFLLAVFYFQSRGAWVGLLGAGLAGLFFYLPKTSQKLALAAASATAVTSLFLFQPQNPNPEPTNAIEKIQSIPDTEANFSNRERLKRWEVALRIFEQYPLLGCGVYQYPNEFKYYLLDWDEVSRISYWNGWKWGAHSEYLTRLAERGGIGLFSFLALIGLLLYRLHRLQSRKVWGRGFVALVAGSLGAWLAQGLVEDLSESSTVLLGVIAIAAAVFTAERKPMPEMPKPPPGEKTGMKPKYLPNKDPNPPENFSP